MKGRRGGRTDDEPVGERVGALLTQVPHDAVDLQCQLTGGRDDDGAGAVAARPLDLGQQLHHRHQERLHNTTHSSIDRRRGLYCGRALHGNMSV